MAGPMLEEVASGQAPSPALRLAAALAEATLRDDLLAPGFLTPLLAERVRATRAAGARIALRLDRQAGATLAETARRLLAAALAGLDADGEARSSCIRRPRDTPCCWSCTSGTAIAATPRSTGPSPNAAP